MTTKNATDVIAYLANKLAEYKQAHSYWYNKVIDYPNMGEKELEFANRNIVYFNAVISEVEEMITHLQLDNPISVATNGTVSRN